MIGYEAVQHDVVVLQSLRFMDREQERRAEVLARFGLVFVAHDEYGEAGRLANLAVEFLLDAVLVLYQGHLSGGAADRLYQEIALAVDRAEAALLDLQQLIGDAGCFRAVAEVGGEYLQLLPLRQLRIAPEQALDVSP